MWLYFHTLVYLCICRSLVTANIEAQVGKWPPCTLCTGASTGAPCTGAAAGWNHIKQPSLLHTPFLSSLSTCGNIWNHVGPCGTVWNHMEPYGTMWNQNKHPLYYTNPFCPGSPDYSKFCIFCWEHGHYQAYKSIDYLIMFWHCFNRSFYHKIN